MFRTIGAPLAKWLRAYARRRIEWRLYVADVQDQRWDDEDMPSDAVRRARAEYKEQRLFEETWGANKTGTTEV